MIVLREVGQDFVGEFAQIEKIMLRFARDKLVFGSVAAVRIDQLNSVHQIAAVIALIAAGAVVTADIASAFHIAIGQEALFAFAVQQGLPLSVQIAAFQQRCENILRYLVMVFGVGVSKEIVADADFPLGFQEAFMIMLKDLQRRRAALVRFHSNGRAMAVGSADHQHVIAPQAMKTGEDISRQIGASQMPDMQIAIGVGPGNRYVNILC